MLRYAETASRDLSPRVAHHSPVHQDPPRAAALARPRRADDATMSRVVPDEPMPVELIEPPIRVR